MVEIKRVLPRTGQEGTFGLDGYLYELIEFFKDAIDNHKTSVVLVFDGKSGFGKTTLNNQVAITLDPNYSLKNLYYTPETFLEGLRNAKPGDYICFDEAMLLSNRSALSSVNKMIIIAMSMIRSKRIYVSFCVNSIFDLDKNIAIYRADLLLHLYGDNLIDRGKYAAFFKAKDGNDRLKDLYLKGKKFYDYSQPKANFVARFPKEFVLDENEYEKQKQAGVNNYLSGHMSREQGLSKEKIEVMKLTEYIKKKYGGKDEEIADCLNKTYHAIKKQRQRYALVPQVP